MNDHKCYARRHMTIREFAVWDYARQVSFMSGVFYLDGRSVAREYCGLGKNVVYRAVNSLRSRGWLITIRSPKRLKNGRLSAQQFKVLSHEEWSSRHPGCCRPIFNAGLPARQARLGNPIQSLNEFIFSTTRLKITNHQDEALAREFPMVRDRLAEYVKVDTRTKYLRRRFTTFRTVEAHFRKLAQQLETLPASKDVDA